MIQISARQLDIMERMQSGEQFPKNESKQTMRTLNSLVKRGALIFNTATMRFELTPMGKAKIGK